MMKVSSYFLFLGKYSMNKERTIIYSDLTDPEKRNF